ncbi:hypothetical protein AB1Y20_006306 [Prymnesium parvum]|uniref:Uncharacterized protein n=1 Tax=Prymnesium parvum TaxID=97485 RepID=A0AB34J476_PRYPA
MLPFLFAAAWTPYTRLRPVNCVALPPTRIVSRQPSDRVDSLVLYGDVGVLIGYGVVQASVDNLLLPIALAQPELFTQNQPVLAAQWQGLALAGLWVLITLSIKGYSPRATRSLPSREALIPLVAAWLGSTAALLLCFSVLGLPLEAELEFALGSATVIGGWRWLYSLGLPLI